MRGTRGQLFADPLLRRFIPAYAGNTKRTRRRLSTTPVHPRVCGEHVGKDGGENRLHRFIPAYAGNTYGHLPVDLRRAVHPRVCGEHVDVDIDPRSCAGSSPRMRGTLQRDRYAEGRHRFIPAYAGNTATRNAIGFEYPVHPRVCGEHTSIQYHAVARYGSSPRMRGTRKLKPQARIQYRFIPAYAGNTSSQADLIPSRSVHPRVCGEHLRCPWSTRKSSGSSPRMRGTRGIGGYRVPKGRFIPAYAGNTWLSPVISGYGPVHPRVCGEHNLVS